MKKNDEMACPRVDIGGQAVMEGVMMKAPDAIAVTVRRPDGRMVCKRTSYVPLSRKHPWMGWPFIRGAVNMVSMLVMGMNVLQESTNMLGILDEEPTKFEKWLEDHFTEKTVERLMMVLTVLSMVAALAMFLFVPKWLVTLVPVLKVNHIVQSFSEGIVKVAIFVAYMAITGLNKDIRRTYEYHGAEHKTIACFEAGLPLTVENVQKQIRLHPRCGTSFIFLTLFISILVMCFVPFTVLWQRFLCSIALLPFTVGGSFEAIQFAGRSDSGFAKALSYPGMQLQRITTREPDARQIECAIAAMKPCIPDNLEDDKW